MTESQGITAADCAAVQEAIGRIYDELHTLRVENADLRQQLEAAKRLAQLAEVGESELQGRVNELESECRSLREELETLRTRQPPKRERPWWARVIGGGA